MAASLVPAQRYPVTAVFERQVAILAATRPQFYAKAGHVLDPDAIADDVNRVIVQAAHQLAKDLGRGCDSSTAIVQRVRRWMSEGKVDPERMAGVEDAFLEADPAAPGEEAVLTELVPLLRKRAQRAVADQAVQDMGTASLARVIKLAEHAEKIGTSVAVSSGIAMGNQAIAAIASLQNLERLAVGVPEVDAYIDQGMPRKALGVVIGGAGDGKSLFLINQTATAFRAGLNCAVATLELSEPLQHARLLANVTDIPINGILDARLMEASKTLARRVAEIARATGRTPKVHVREFAAYATQTGEITDWWKHLEQEMGEPLHLGVVDYADKIGAKDRKRQTSDYDTGREVYEALRADALDHDRWIWTASQSKRKSDKKQKTKDLDDVADSLHKVRIADLVITLNVEEDDQGQRQISYFVGKNRIGESRRLIGPYPVDFATGKVGG